jgi:hypothetical protein
MKLTMNGRNFPIPSKAVREISNAVLKSRVDFELQQWAAITKLSSLVQEKITSRQTSDGWT